MTVAALARSLSTDGRFSVADAGRLIEEAARTGAADEVRALLSDPSTFAGAAIDPGALRRLGDFLSAAAPTGDAIGALPDGSQVFLKEGVFVAAPDDDLPATPGAYGQLMYRAAKLFAEPGQNFA